MASTSAQANASKKRSNHSRGESAWFYGQSVHPDSALAGKQTDGERGTADLARALAMEGTVQDERDRSLAEQSTRFQRALMSSNRFRNSLLG
jgi:hypothetical protein